MIEVSNLIYLVLSLGYIWSYLLYFGIKYTTIDYFALRCAQRLRRPECARITNNSYDVTSGWSSVIILEVIQFQSKNPLCAKLVK